VEARFKEEGEDGRRGAVAGSRIALLCRMSEADGSPLDVLDGVGMNRTGAHLLYSSHRRSRRYACLTYALRFSFLFRLLFTCLRDIRFIWQSTQLTGLVG
jgi:hypothetical protein